LQIKAEQLKPYLGQAVNANEHSFIRFNNANFSDGLFVHIAENTVLEKPLQLLHIVSETNTLAATRNIIVLESNAQAQIIESFVSIDNFNYLTATVNEVFLAENAKLNWYKVQVESENASHFGGTYTKQNNNSYFEHYNIALGALLARNDVHNDLKNGAECELNGLTVVAKKQHCDNHTRIIHAEPNAISREYYKSIADNRARAVFQGRIIVAENAQKTSSTMNNRNLLLSTDAEIDTKPQLEIYADDVQCSHGVTIGQLSEQSIFYLQSRGIDIESARNILTFAFANEMVDKISIESLKQWIFMLLSKHFPQKVLD
jgi:Fe-S cluster assembly protein SufD